MPASAGRACAGRAEGVQFGAAEGGEAALFVAQQPRQRQRVVAGGHQRLVAAAQFGPGAALVDGKVVDDRIHRKGHGAFQLALGRAHHRHQPILRLDLAPRVEDKAHAAARHAAQHPEAPEISAKLSAGASISVSV